MSLVSSDTNVWIVFHKLSRIDWPFLLPYSYVMERRAMKDELLSPQGVLENAKQHGLCSTQLSEDEFALVISLSQTYGRLSLYDCFALSIAKSRGCLLLTNDGPLRKAAIKEGVECHGVLWVCIECCRLGLISKDESLNALEEMRERREEYHLKNDLVDKAMRKVRSL